MPNQAVIHTKALQHNLQQIVSRLPENTQICSAVKANGYGHGAIESARAFLAAGAHMLGVASPEEGIQLRTAGFAQPIILFTPFFPAEAQAIAEHDLIPFVPDLQRIQLLQAAAKKTGKTCRFILKIDTGMGRVGCKPGQAAELAQTAIQKEQLELFGTATHFAAADSSDESYTRNQLKRFHQALEAMRSAGINPGLISASNSGAVIGFSPGQFFDLARPGIMQYGYFPSHEVERNLSLQPAMTFETAVAYIKRVSAGESISYGMTYTATEDCDIATIPVGYADGIFRTLSNKGSVWINGRLYPIVGRVCMDQFMVNLGLDSKVQLYDRVVIFGPPQQFAGAQDAPLTAEDIADLCNTIPYEITCAVSARIPRVYSNT